MTYRLIGSPKSETQYSDEYETVMVCDVEGEDGSTGDVWIVAGVPDYLRGSSDASGTQRGYERVRVFGDTPDTWCPPSLDYEDAEKIVAACESAALDVHRTRMAQEVMEEDAK